MYIKCWHIIGIIFTIFLGCSLHFTYEWSGEKKIVGLFSTVNESTWEHLKLLITPILLFSIIEYIFYGKYIENFVPIKLLSILLGMATIVVVFYTYKGILGNHYLILDISTFILAVLVAYIFSYKMLGTDVLTSDLAVKLSWFGVLLLVLCVMIFTFAPPRIGLFKDPVSGGYGI